MPRALYTREENVRVLERETRTIDLEIFLTFSFVTEGTQRHVQSQAQHVQNVSSLVVPSHMATSHSSFLALSFCPVTTQKPNHSIIDAASFCHMDFFADKLCQVDSSIGFYLTQLMGPT